MKSIIIIICCIALSNTYSQKACKGFENVVYQGQSYSTVQIGKQCWFKENLNVGKMILAKETQSNNKTIEKYCYNDDEKNCAKYGGLYVWNEAMQYAKSESGNGICPSGWHIPTEEEIEVFVAFIKKDPNSISSIEAKGFDKTREGRNSLGFSALMGGFYVGLTKQYIGNEFTFFWSSTEKDQKEAHTLSFNPDILSVPPSSSLKENGLSIRCIKN